MSRRPSGIPRISRPFGVNSIAKRPTGYVLSHVEGTAHPSVNGNPVGDGVVSLKNGDIIDLAGTQMQFIQG